MTLLLVYAGVALVVSFTCSLLEACLLSVTPTFVAHYEDTHPRVGQKLRRLKEDVDRPLAAILSLNTVANTIGAAGVGAEAARLWGEGALAVASGVLTLVILVCSELVPKTLGAVYWQRFVTFAAFILPPMIKLLTPLVLLGDVVTKLIKRGRVPTPSISRAEIAALAGLAEAGGTIDPTESRILRSLIHCGTLRVRDIMTPRTVVFWLDETTTLAEVLDKPGAMNFSRIPVGRGSIDNILGYVLKNEILLRAARQDQERTVGEFVRDHLVVPSTLPVPALFERMLDSREHIAVVTDEHGGVDGLVTMEDVIETVLGMEIVDEADAVQDMREMARAKWQDRAKRLGTVPPPQRERSPSDPPARG
ncbi:MAG: hemolysin family protein [Polyangiales bacterium]|nr:HlyC/CorC family transporter [Myxococcales bacterium]MCB9657139.1 HlyC/CorC family transporter [Sandaracinaceae bacterium]